MVELMVGITIGLIVVAGATLMMSTQLSENRKLLLETQVQQDLRSTADIITRELCRIGYDPAPNFWYDGDDDSINENSYAVITPGTGTGLTEIRFDYRRRSGEDRAFGFKREGYAIKSNINGEYTALTDSRVMRVTNFTVDLSTGNSYQLPCPRLCSDGSQDCWPVVRLRTATVNITAEAASDPSVVRSVRSQVRLRNDWFHQNMAFVCPK